MRMLYFKYAGYKVPLFISRNDTIENLELIEFEVYWEICAQVLNKTRNK